MYKSDHVISWLKISPFPPERFPAVCILIPVQIHLLILEAEQHLGTDTVLQGLQSVSKSPERLLISTQLQLGSWFCLGTAGASLFPVMSHWGLRNPLCPPLLSIPRWPPRSQNRPHR